MLPKLAGWQADRGGGGGMLPSAFARIARTCLFALWHLQQQASPRPSRVKEREREKQKTTQEIRLEIFAASRVAAEWRCPRTIASKSRQGAREKVFVSPRGRRCA